MLASLQLAASPASEQAVKQLQQRWAEIKYQMHGKEQKNAYARLVSEAELVSQKYDKDAGVWVWSGIIKSSYAGAKGGLGALKYARDARSDLEKSLELNPGVLDGSAYTSLGTLYFSVPGWPISFGDDKKAGELLRKALQLNPQGIDANFFYAEYLRDQGKDEDAKTFYEKALHAPDRPGRELADRGRREEIQATLASLQ